MRWVVDVSQEARSHGKQHEGAREEERRLGSVGLDGLFGSRSKCGTQARERIQKETETGKLREKTEGEAALPRPPLRAAPVASTRPTQAAAKACIDAWTCSVPMDTRMAAPSSTLRIADTNAIVRKIA